MSLRIQTNVEAFDAHRNLVTTENKMSSAMDRLSSGYRINRAADAAAGLAISEKLLAQICAEISNIGSQTAFNGINLLTGGATITFQVGANDGQTISVSGINLFGSGSTFSVDSNLFSFSGTVSLSAIDAAIQNVSNSRSN